MASSALARGNPEIPGRVKFLDFMPDADPTTPGAILDSSNVYPTTKGYRAYPSLAPYALNALPSACQGAAAGILGSAPFVVAGTTNQLYLLNASTLLLESQGLALTPITGRWRFDTYGHQLIAVNGIDPNQAYSGTGTFAPLGGSPPVASLVQATDYSVFLIEPNSHTWHSSLSATIWVNSIATQTLQGDLDSTDGNITAAHKLRNGITLFKPKAFHMGRFIGPPFYWQFDTVSEQVGAPCQEAVANLGDIQYWPGPDDFFFFDGSSLQRIPNNLKEWFFRLLDNDHADKIAARWDQRKNLIFWHFPSIHANPAGTLDHWICFNTRTGRWAANTASTSSIIEMPVFTPTRVSGGLTYGSFTARYATYAAAKAATPSYGDLRPQNEDVSGAFGADHALKTYNGDPGLSFITTHDLGDRHSMYQVTRVRPEFSIYPQTAIGTAQVIAEYVPGKPVTTLGLTRPLSTDGWFNLVSTKRLQRFKLAFQSDFEIIGFEAMAEYAGEV